MVKVARASRKWPCVKLETWFQASSTYRMVSWYRACVTYITYIQQKNKMKISICFVILSLGLTVMSANVPYYPDQPPVYGQLGCCRSAYPGRVILFLKKI